MARYIGAKLGDIVRIVKYEEYQDKKYVKELSYRAVLSIWNVSLLLSIYLC